MHWNVERAQVMFAGADPGEVSRVSVESVDEAYAQGVKDGVQQEGERLLARIHEVIRSWDAEPDANLRGLVQAAFEVFSTAITHRGVTREQAIAAALKRAKNGPRPHFWRL